MVISDTSCSDLLDSLGFAGAGNSTNSRRYDGIPRCER
ncbi:hypothetical protein GFS60_02181 [Rhodococcus sp. WAY2]|nr:hypothetical protein GFS60_02181 [Rhodococcus sp. WAY2]